MKTIQVSNEDQDLLIRGLQMRICYIETGTPILRANDAIAQGQHKLIKPLEPAQQEVIRRSEALVKMLLTAR